MVEYLLPYTCEHCEKSYKTNQALGDHTIHCVEAKEAAKKILTPNIAERSLVFKTSPNQNSTRNQNRLRADSRQDTF